MVESTLSAEITFESELGANHPSYLADYQHVQGRVALPVTVYLEMALAAAQTALPSGPYQLSRVDFKQVLLLTDDAPRTIRIVLTPEPSGGATFRILSPPSDQDQRDGRWTLYAEGIITKAAALPLARPSLLPASTRDTAREQLKFSLFYFGSSEAAFTNDRYDLLLEGARFADENGFAAVWTPERHFHQFGGSYPSPAVLSAALATVTRNVHLRAGSVVLPLHHPLRIAEEWSVVDNLSRGRVGISFATGWNADDFVLAPENYEHRKERLWSGIQLVQRFWRGETVFLPSGSGKTAGVNLFPLPMQAELPTWVTIVKNPETYRKAGEIGAHVLTNLLGQTIEELAENIKLYRAARAQHGYDPDAGEVTLLVHTFVGDDLEQVRRIVREPFCHYLKSTVGIIRNLVKSLDLRLDLDSLTKADMDDLLTFAFERYFKTAALMGTPQTCRETVERLKQIGVNEIGCFIDFGVDFSSVKASLQPLKVLKESSTSDAAQTRIAVTPLDAIAEIRLRCAREIAETEHYGALCESGVQLGKSFQGVHRLWLGNGEALGELQLPTALESEAEAYQLHPALLDAALQVLLVTLPASDERSERNAPYVPVGLDGLRIFRPSDTHLWSHAVLRKDAAPGTAQFTGDVRLMNDAGQTVAEVSGLRLQRLDKSVQQVDKDALGDLFYELEWQLHPHVEGEGLSVTASLADHSGQWIIFADDAGLGHNLAARLMERGESCTLVAPGTAYKASVKNQYHLRPGNKEDVTRLLEETCGTEHAPLRGIIHLWSMETGAHESGLDALTAIEVLGCETVLALLQALAPMNVQPSPQLVFGTRGAQPVGAAPGQLSIAQSLIWGLGRVLQLEHPELRCRLIDLAPTVEDGEDLLLVHELFSQSPENQLAFREGARAVPRLQRISVDSVAPIEPQPDGTHHGANNGGAVALEAVGAIAENLLRQVRASAVGAHVEGHEDKTLPEKTLVGNVRNGDTLFLPDATYLITGGLGVLGLLITHWMVQQGARHLVLVGRRGASNEATRTLNILRETGAAIVVMQADVAQEEQLAEVLNRIGRTMPPLRGIFHAAMQIEDGVLLQMDRERFSAAVKPKAHGAWNLHALTAEMPLDFFVLFSSAASLFGSVGQGNYVAGNAFLDALAHERSGLGLPALTINWGQWAETHLTTRPGLKERLALLGMNPLPPERGFEALAWLLRHDVTQVAVMSVQWQKIFASFPAGMRPPMLAEVAPAFSDEATTKTETEHVVPLDREAFLSLPEDERQPWMVSHVRNLVAHVLRLSPSEVSIEQPLNLIGGLDSLMAIEIKNRLETGLGIELPLVRLLEGPTIVEFAEIILQELGGAAAGNGDEKFAEVLERVKNLSEEEVQAMLEQERRNG